MGEPDRIAHLRGLVVAEQVRGLYTKAALPFVTVVVNASLLGWVLWSPQRATAITVWLGTLYAITLVRVVTWRLYLGAGREDEGKRWGWIFAAGSCANGLAWGASALALYPPGDVVLQAVILLVLGGMTAGAASSTATFLPAFAAFTVPALTPMTVRLVAEGDKIHVALGMMAALFAVAMTQIAATGGRRLIVSEELRLKNAALLDDLNRAQASLKAESEELERRVTARTNELTSAYEKLAISERMVSVGTLAAGIAHEINNPLAFVLSNLEYVQTSIRSLESAKLDDALDAIGDATSGATRVRDIVRDLNTFSRGAHDQVEPVDLTLTLETSIRMAANELRHRAHVERELGPVPLVMGHAGKVAQLFLNLLVNAAQSIPEGNASENVVRVVTRTDDDGRAVVEIHDTGAGIPREILPRILDPFFTTKPVGQGIGLGLSICHGIVRAMEGELQIESEVGKGSVFRVLLPPSASALSSLRPASLVQTSGRARVLVIDDEPMFGKGVARLLGEEHEVVLETVVKEALSRLSAGERFDVILCDMMMPDASGIEFYGRVRAIDTKLVSRIVFTTGGAFTDAAREFLDRVKNPRVAKPFTKTEIEAAMVAVRGSS